MNNEEKKRRCKSCGKLLLDEKMPFCRRCVLEGRNKVTYVVGLVLAALGARVFLNNNSSDNDDTV